MADPHNTEALTTIRRNTHTLKGSGRMVGLNDLGEAAWELEQTLNLWLRQDQWATPELMQLIEGEHTLFSDWVHHLESGQGRAPRCHGAGCPGWAFTRRGTAGRAGSSGSQPEPLPVIEPVIEPIAEPGLEEIVLLEAAEFAADEPAVGRNPCR